MNPADVTTTAATHALRQAMIGAAGPGATGWLGDYPLPGAADAGRRVLILGAGVGGLTAAYELSRRGYQCTVLEAQERVGGRNRTARNGDRLYEFGPDGDVVETHTCAFDHGLYLNLGPGRIPHHHRRVLKYCRELGVALEPYVMETTANLTHLATGAGAVRWRNRRVANDTRGHIAERLAQTLRQRNDPADAGLLALLQDFGPLDSDYRYHGSTRSGFAELDVHDFPRPVPPLSLEQLVESKFWTEHFYQAVDHLWQATMFQPVGGMDQIVKAFENTIRREFGDIIHLRAEVIGISLDGPNGVTIEYQHDGALRSETADYCVSNIPLPVLGRMTLDGFTSEFREAIGAVEFASTCKVGWQAQRRFWEENADGIYGGISWTNHLINQIWYPSNDYFSHNGTLTGAYNFDDDADEFGDMAPQERLAVARAGAAELHAEFADESIVPTGRGVSIAWHKVPYQHGGWAGWDPDNADHQQAYKQLLQPEGVGRFFVVGDQASPLPGWQEGAMMSADYVVGQILGAIPLEVPEPVQVPDSAALTQGHRPARTSAERQLPTQQHRGAVQTPLSQ